MDLCQDVFAESSFLFRTYGVVEGWYFLAAPLQPEKWDKP